MGRLRLRGRRTGKAGAIAMAGIAAALAAASSAAGQPRAPARASPRGAHAPSLGTVSIHERGRQPIELVVDGVDCGPAPWQGTLEAGKHDVFGRSGTLTTARRSFVVTGGGSTDVEVVAVPRASGSRPLPPAP